MKRLAILVVLFGTLGCGPSAERLQCLNYCEHQNDVCLLNAPSSNAVQECTTWTSQCVASCPVR